MAFVPLSLLFVIIYVIVTFNAFLIMQKKFFRHWTSASQLSQAPSNDQNPIWVLPYLPSLFPMVLVAGQWGLLNTSMVLWRMLFQLWKINFNLIFQANCSTKYQDELIWILKSTCQKLIRNLCTSNSSKLKWRRGSNRRMKNRKVLKVNKIYMRNKILNSK